MTRQTLIGIFKETPTGLFKFPESSNDEMINIAAQPLVRCLAY
jgi:hypothetical protein